jgi:hypothetical protein
MSKFAFILSTLLLATACTPKPPVITTPFVQPPALESLVRLNLPNAIISVDEGAKYLLQGTGYKVTWDCGECQYSKIIKTKPVSPLFFQPNETATLKQALVLLVGSQGKLLIDEENKLVSLTFVDAKPVIKASFKS